MMYAEQFIIVALGMTVSNFLWQAATKRDWERASERSFFQFFALMALWFTMSGAPAHAQTMLPINNYDQHAYTTDDPVDPSLLGLATNAGRWSITPLDGCAGVVAGLNVALYMNDDGTDFAIVPMNDDGRFTDMIDENGLPTLPNCHIALGTRMSNVPCFMIYSDLLNRAVCDVNAETD